MSDASILLELANTDYLILRLKKQLDELPQRGQLLELRTKKAEVNAKAEQVALMHHEAERTIKALQDEAESLKEKIALSQTRINGTTNYKEVAALNKEIEGNKKRIEKIEFETLRQMDKVDKVAQVDEQVKGALARLKKQDDELLAVYQTQAGALKKEMSAAQVVRENLAGQLPADLLARYMRACESKGGRGAAHIEGTHCSGCRVELTEGQMEKLRNGERIGECPYCHRLLVVEV
ncbi:MAG: hypothetical protein FWF91_01680 [Coriobacteriia bacterium]|jgi:predicted  nucleic acid-binding Zn-ribbon protein|nr:hypothetical protein [Coriobacteriia bacterium]